MQRRRLGSEVQAKEPIGTGRVWLGLRWSPPFPTEVVLIRNAGSGAVGCDPSVALLDWYCLAGEMVLVMERPTPSQDLLHYWWKNRPLSEEFAKELTIQLGQALSDLHKNKVFHRDIKLEKPRSNKRRPGPGSGSLTSGVVAWSQHDSSFSGTKNYMPPEVIIRGQYCAGPTSVWQIGCTLVDMLSRGPRFSTINFIRGDWELPEGLSQGCQDFIFDCLMLRPELRPALETLSLHPWLSS